jgi:hypothetical protein
VRVQVLAKCNLLMPMARAAARAIALIAVHASMAAQPPVIPVGPDAYVMWDRWAYQRLGERAYMRSTYDRAGGNPDASHFLYQQADDFNVTLDVQGPGELYFARFNHWHGSPWHYEVDGVDHLVQESSSADPLQPVADSVFLPPSAFPPPLALTWSQTHGADLSWVPIGFQRSFRMAYTRTYYGTGYYIYHQFVDGAPLSRPIEAWDAQRAPDAAAVELLQRAGSDIAPPAGTDGVQQASGQLNLPPSAAVTVWTHGGGAGVLRALEFSVPRSQALAFSSARLKLTWDDRPSASIDAPVALFYGAGLLYNRDQREYLVRSLPMVIRYDSERVYLSCYFPMPFFRSVNIQLVGVRDSAINDVRWTLRYAPFRDPPNSVGYFHASYVDDPVPQLGRDLVLLDTRSVEGGGDWSGQLVGTSIVFSHAAVLSTLEGDPRFFFDDSQTPQAQGTGTEEWCGGGDYWGGVDTTLPLAGHPIGARSPRAALDAADQVESAYRFLLADLMPFGRNALIRLEHGGVDESLEHYETVTYWYGLPAASLLKTDELAVGDAASEAQHGYRAVGASPPYTLSSRYEWGPDSLNGVEIYPAISDRGRTIQTRSEFTLQIDPANVGVMLRRKLDYAYPNQRAEVDVRDASSQDPGAWRPAGVWYLAGSNTTVYSNGRDHGWSHYLPGSGELGSTEHIVETSNRRFRDDEFLLPRQATEGRRAIRIRIRFTPVRRPLFPGAPMPELAWSEMRYTAYSIVMPAFTLNAPAGASPAVRR